MSKDVEPHPQIWLVDLGFNVPRTVRSYGDGTSVYSLLRQTGEARPPDLYAESSQLSPKDTQIVTDGYNQCLNLCEIILKARY